MIQRFKTTALMIVVIAVMSAAAVAQTTLTVLTAGDDGYIDNTRRYFAEVERIFPDLRFEIMLGSLDSFIVQSAAGVPPDLLRLYGQNVPEYAAQGYLTDLTPYIDASDLVDPTDFIPVILEEGLSYRGRIYSIPFGVSITSFFYNKNRFDEVGSTYPDETWSWEQEGIAIGRLLSPDVDGDGNPDRFFTNEPPAYELYPFIYSTGAQIFSPDMDEFLGNTQDVADALDFIRELGYVHQVMPNPGQAGGPFQLLNQRSAAEIVGSWFITLLKANDPGFQWDIAPLPTFRGDRGTNVWPETPWAIPVGAAHEEEAWRVLEFIGSVEGQRLATELGLAGPPVRLSVAGSDFARENPALNVGALIETSTLPYTRPLPTAPGVARNMLDQAMLEVRLGAAPGRTALENVATAIQAELDAFVASLEN